MKFTGVRLILLMLLISGALIGAPPASSAQELTKACTQRHPVQPPDYDFYFCFYELARDQGVWKEAAQALHSMSRENGYATLSLGHIEAYNPDTTEQQRPQQLAKAEELYLKAAKQLEDAKDVEGQILAYQNLYDIYYQQDRLEETLQIVALAQQAVQGMEGSIPEARALILQAKSLHHFGEDLGRAYRLLKRVEPLILADGTYRLKREYFIVLGAVAESLGNFREAFNAENRVSKLSLEQGDSYALATAKYNRAFALLGQLGRLPDKQAQQDLLTLAEEALQLAKESGHFKLVMKAHIMVGDLLSDSAQGREAARDHYVQCIELARHNDTDILYVALWSLAWNHMKSGNPEAAHRVIAEATSIRLTNDRFLSWSGRTRLQTSWELYDKGRALEDSREVLREIESLRGMQADSSSREGLFSAWTSSYYLLSGRLLQAFEESSDRQDLKDAFQVVEQMRARELLEVLKAGKAAPVQTEELLSVRNQIASINRRLRSALPPQERHQRLADLRRLELREAEIRSESYREQIESIRSHPDRFASLDEVEANLEEDEALLSFQVGLWDDLYGDFGGGSWLIASTRQGSSIYRLPDRTWLHAVIPVMLGLIERRDGLESRSSPTLYEKLLQEALADLPHQIRSLVIIPDGTLHHLPFGLLQAAEGVAPLADHYHLSVAPSATLWLGWKREEPSPAAVPALALADPQLPAIASPRESGSDQQPDRSDEDLLPLPNARQEGSQLVERLGHDSRLVVGANASEQFVKSALLQRYALLHFATHALVNDEFPERSSIMLAPGSENEDGRLQIREIVDLDLKGQVIVLSACSSASGTVLSGEGVVGLARAFFKAGARSVVGSLWPLRDDDAQQFFEAFYARLSQGHSIAVALNAAQKDRIQQGEPAQGWAGLVVMGDGNYIPFPGGLPQASPLGNGLFTLIAALATAAALSAILVLRSRRRRGFQA